MSTPDPTPQPPPPAATEADRQLVNRIIKLIRCERIDVQPEDLIAHHVAAAVAAATAELRATIVGQEEQLKSLVNTDCGFGGYIDALMKDKQQAESERDGLRLALKDYLDNDRDWTGDFGSMQDEADAGLKRQAAARAALRSGERGGES